MILSQWIKGAFKIFVEMSVSIYKAWSKNFLIGEDNFEEEKENFVSS